MTVRFAAILAAAFLSACASTGPIPLSKESSQQLQGKTVASTHYEVPTFMSFTAGKAVFGLVGAAVMAAEGNTIVRENNIPDPANAISQSLLDKLAVARGITVVPTQAQAKSDDVPVLVSLYPGSDFILDVKTVGWMINYYPTDWVHYKVTYNARVRLINSASKKVAAEGTCQTVQGDDANPPTKDQLTENSAALLKSYLSKAASSCVDVFAKDLLQI